MNPFGPSAGRVFITRTLNSLVGLYILFNRHVSTGMYSALMNRHVSTGMYSALINRHVSTGMYSALINCVTS